MLHRLNYNEEESIVKGDVGNRMGRKQSTKKQSSELTTWLFGIGAVVIFAGVVAGGIYLSNAGTPEKTATPPKRENCAGSPVLDPKLAGVEHFLCEGQDHVADGTRVTYKTDPPTSGNHWAGPTPPGFYAPGQADAYTLPERLVHSLEHGNVVIYYNPTTVTTEQQDRLKALARKWPGQWDGVVVVPRNDAEYPIILTAWEYMQKLKTWNEDQINDFVRTFAGRGPENPMR
jgi:hypothetical protein